MPPFRAFHLTRWNRGTILQGLPDAIPDDAFRLTRNIRIDRTLGAITNRAGWMVQTASALVGGEVTWLAKLLTLTADFAYAQAGSTIYRMTGAWGSPVSIVTSVAGTITGAGMVDGMGTRWQCLVSSNVASKDNGTVIRTLGIAPPTALGVTAALAADLSTSISTMDATTGWTGENLATGPATEATIKQEGTNSLTFTIEPNTIGSIARAVTVDLDTLAGGDDSVKLDDYIHLWVRVDRPERLDYLQFDFDLDGTTFAENYYSVRLASLSRLNQGRDQWTRVQVRKSEFQRFGDSTDDWADVEGARISFATNDFDVAETVTIYVDDFKLRGGFGIEGDIAYTVTYRNSTTGGRGNPPKDGEGTVIYTTSTFDGAGDVSGDTPFLVDRRRVTLDLTTVAQGGANHPGDVQINTMQIWRRGGIFAGAVLVDEIPDTQTTFTDTVADATLVLQEVALELDNDVPPAGTTRVVFGPDPSGRLFMIVDEHRLYFSKPFEDDECRFDNWPEDNFALISNAEERALAGIATDTETLVWTTSRTYRITGSGDETFLPVPIPDSHEIVGTYAVSAGANSAFFAANDGVYEHRGLQQVKLTEAIDPFFNGRTISDTVAMATSVTARRNVWLAYHPDPESDFLAVLYPEASTTPNRALIIKRNLQTGQFTECFFDRSNLTDLRALYSDTEANQLFAGAANGHIYRIEDPSTQTDAGTDIEIAAQGRSVDFGLPAASKRVASFHIEGSTGGQPIAVAARYNRHATTESLGTMTTTNTTEAAFFPAADPQARWKDVTVRLGPSSPGAAITITRISVAASALPEPYTFIDSDILTYAVIRLCKFLEFDLFAPTTDVTVVLEIDGVLRDTRLWFANTQQRVARHYLPPGLKGYTYRVTLTSTQPFELYRGMLYSKPLGSTMGWEPQELTFASRTNS